MSERDVNRSFLGRGAGAAFWLLLAGVLAAPMRPFPAAAQISCLTLSISGPGSVQTQNLAAGCSENWQCVQTNDGDTSYVFSTDTTVLGPRTDLYAVEDTAVRPDTIV